MTSRGTGEPGLGRIMAPLSKMIAAIRDKVDAGNHRDKEALDDGFQLQTFNSLIDHCNQCGIEVVNRAKLLKYDSLKGRKALLVSHELDYSGAPIVLLGMAAVLKEAGYRVVLASWRKGNLIKDYERLGLPVLIDPGCIWSSSVAGYASLFDVVVANTIVTAPVISALADSPVPVLWWIHEAALAYEDTGLTERMPELLPANVRAYAVGPYAKRLLSRQRPRYEVNELLYGVPDDKDRPIRKLRKNREADSKFIFGIVGSIEARKGQDILARAIRLLPKQIISYCNFLIVGENHDEKIYGELRFLEAEFPQNVKLCGRIEHKKINDIYKQIDCLICPSRDDPMPVVAAEAMQHGKPIICSSNTGTAEIVQTEKCGLVYPEDNEENLAIAIQKMLEYDPKTYKGFRKHSKSAFEKHFSTNSFAKNTIHAIDSLVDMRADS